MTQKAAAVAGDGIEGYHVLENYIQLSKVVPTGAQPDDSARKLRLPPSGRKDTEMTPSFREFLLALLETDHSQRLTASEAVYRIPRESEWLEITTKKISL